MPYQKTGKIVSIIFLVILLMSIFSIMLSHNDAGVIRKPDDFSDIDPTESEQEDNSIFSPIPEKEPATASPTSTPVIHSSTEYEIYNSNSYMNSRTSASRANETYDYDLRIERININYTGIFRWPVMNNDKIYFYYILIRYFYH